MGIGKLLDNLAQYFSVAIARIFGPTDDAYPVVGFQPFEGDPYTSDNDSDW